MSAKLRNSLKATQSAEKCKADGTTGGTSSCIVEVIIPGIEKSLYYSHDKKNNFIAGIGWQVLVSIRNRQTIGYVVNTYTNFEQLPDDVTRFDPAKLKSVVDGVEIFNSELLDIIKWLSTYYGCRIADALDTALPKYKFPKRLRTAATPQAPKNNTVSRPNTHIDSVPLTKHQEIAHEAISKCLDKHIFKPFLLFGVTGSGKTEVYIRLIQNALKTGRSALVIVPEISLTPQIVGRFKERLGVPIAVIHSLIGKSAKFSDWQKILAGEIRVAIGARSAIFAPLSNLGIIVVDEEHDGSYKQSDGVRYNARDLALIRARQSSCPVVLGSATPSLESLHNVQQKRYTLLEMPERATNVSMPSIEIVDISRLRKMDMASPSISPQLYLALKEVLENKEQAIVLYNRRGFSSYLQCNTCHKSLSCPHCSVTLTYHQRSGRLICHYCAYCRETITTCPVCCNPKLSVYAQIESSTNTDSNLALHTPADLSGIQTAENTGPGADGQQDAPGTLIHCGGGTEKVEEEFQALFPLARIVRMDRDTVTKKDAHRKILETMHNKEADILIGTQMIAKGHDIAGVSLVGIIDADVGINMPDFRASERSYQLLQQASGRAGRREKLGRVVIQTRNPNHPAIVAISTGKQKAFMRYELDFRKELNYPPYTKMLRIIVSSQNLTLAKNSADKLGEALRAYVSEMTSEFPLVTPNPVTATTKTQQIATNIAALPESTNSPKQESYLQILGPTPAPIEKLRDRYRYHFIVKSSSVKYINLITQALAETKSKMIGNSDLRISIDVDPVEML